MGKIPIQWARRNADPSAWLEQPRKNRDRRRQNGLGAMKENSEGTTVHPTPETAPFLTAMGYLSPVQLVGLTAFGIFVAEAVIMFLLSLFPLIPMVYEAILDAVLLTLLASPFLYFLLFRPLVLHIDRRRAAEDAILSVNATLERRIKERTEDLSLTNKALQREIQERRATEEQIRRTNDFVQRIIESAPCIVATIDVNTLKSNYINGRIEDFLGISPESVAASGGVLLDTVVAGSSIDRLRRMVRDLVMAPHGEIARGRIELMDAEGASLIFEIGIVVANRTAIGEAEEILFVATPTDNRA
jgi:PAS domain-containing protein